MKNGNPKALIPIGVFVVLYLGLGIVFEYVLGISMGFYSVPITVIFLIALLVACLQNPKLKFDEKLKIMGKGIGDANIVIMILIFLVAGIFVGTVGRSSAESVAYFMLNIIPARFAAVVLFVVSCLVSLTMGTSVGTVTLIAPIGLAVADASGFSPALCVSAVLGGAMFGDNLSFISDTTIAACKGQDCGMKDKFKANFKIALPAAIAAVIVIYIISLGTAPSEIIHGEYNLLQTIPYILVLITGIIGLNVFIVLIIGIVSGAVIMLATGAAAATELLFNMGSGVMGMFETAMVAVLVSAICALIKEYGGFVSLLNLTKKIFKGKKAGQLGMGILVGIMDIATANNTVAIVISNPIAKEMAENYGISPIKTASVLDTFSCIFQGILPYGAQMLIVLAAANELGYIISAFDIIPLLFYPFFLLISSLVFIFIIPDKQTLPSKKVVKKNRPH